MSKKPSTETQLKALKQVHNRLKDELERVKSSEVRYFTALQELQKRLMQSETERSKLLDAMCAQVKREPPTPEEPRELRTFKLLNQNKLAAIRDLRNAGGRTLSDSKTIVEGWQAQLTAAEIKALEPHGSWV